MRIAKILHDSQIKILPTGRCDTTLLSEISSGDNLENFSMCTTKLSEWPQQIQRTPVIICVYSSPVTRGIIVDSFITPSLKTRFYHTHFSFIFHFSQLINTSLGTRDSFHMQRWGTRLKLDWNKNKWEVLLYE